MSSVRPPTRPGLPADPDGVLYRLSLPYSAPPPPLRGNFRGHWSARNRAAQQLRSDVVILGRQAGLHRLTGIRRVTVQLVWAPGNHRRRDEDNLAPMQKVACDGLARGPREDLIGLDLVPDDTAEWMTKLGPRIAPPPERGMWLDVWVECDGSVT